VLTLLVLQGPDKGRRFELPDQTTLIGRESAQVLLTDETVSRRHCEIVPDRDRWVLRDLGSINGTYINGVRTSSRHELKLGDQIRAGRTLMVFGAQPGISRSFGEVSLSGLEAGMDSSIMHTLAPTSDDSMVLAVPEPAAAAISNLKILYELGATLGSGFGAQQILEVVMDLVFEHVKAERGMILLLDVMTGDLNPVVVRTRLDKSEPAPAEEEKFHASSTIVNHVLSTGEGVLSSNAMTDKRFSKGKSVHNLGIRSALCVPIKAPKLDEKTAEAVTGLIYIDSSVANYTYSPDQLRLLTAIGMQAGMAIQNQKLYRSAMDAERLAAIGETTAALSHSIKNILQALRGGADVVEMGLRSSNLPQATKGWAIVSRNLDRMFALTMNLLAYSRKRDAGADPIQAPAIIDECLELISSAANRKGVMVVADIDRQQPPVPVDPDGLHQVLMNLLGNALDAVEAPDGLIRVLSRFDPEHNEAVIEVVDNGVGIDPSLAPHLFELFHSTKGNRGTGLGLAVARKIVEEHKGTITVRSKPGRGATFSIRLPLSSDADSSDTHAPSARRSTEGPGKQA
jgi:signal transduction histidine kinase